MMDRIVVLGATGQLGTDMVEVLNHRDGVEVIPLKHEDVECTDSESVRRAIKRIEPQVVINCAAFVRVDECESRPDVAFNVNTLGALYVARACADAGALCVYVSTDYVFDGTKSSPYVESDSTHPLNVYGTSKLAGEHLVQQTASQWLIVRVASLFGKTGARGKGGNFLETILSKAKNGEPLNVVDDIRISPTYTRDAAKALSHLIQSGTTGVFHLANSGFCSWYDFAKAALELVGFNVPVKPVPSTAFQNRARRPANSSLSSERARDFLPDYPRPWPEALKAYLKEKGHVRQA